MFDVKQCEADGWKCEACDGHGYWWNDAKYLGRLMDGTHVAAIKGQNYFLTNAEIRNLPKPKVKRWNGETFVKSININGQLSDAFITIPLIEDSTGIRVDHSDAVIEALDGLKRYMVNPPQSVISDINVTIAKIKKDRGE